MAVLDQSVARRLEHVVTELMRLEPVIVLHGPRSVGKSTLLGRIAEKFGRSVLDLDDPLTRRPTTTPSYWRRCSSSTCLHDLDVTRVLGVLGLGRTAAG